MAPVNSLRGHVARASRPLDNRSTSADQVKAQAKSTAAAQRVMRAPAKVPEPMFARDTFTPDAGSSTRAHTTRLLGGDTRARALATATANAAANAGNRPVASYPDPSELPGVAEADYAYGQLGPSPNETGMIGGAAELAQYAYAGYNRGRFGPVSIAPAKLYEGDTTTDVHLVSLSGTEPVPEQSTGWITNFRVGSQLNSPGLRNAKEAILRTVPEGSTLVLTGHSQGGMIAQQLAADPDLKEKYNIKSTVAFGSPLISAGTREGEVHRIAARLDPVPKLSVESIAGFGWALPGEQRIRSHTWNPIASHSDNYTDESNPQLARMDALGRVNPRTPATIEVDVSQRVFFSSPTNTIAGTPAGGEITPPPPASPWPGNYPLPFPFHPVQGPGVDPTEPGSEPWVSFPLNPFPSSPVHGVLPPLWDGSSDGDESLDDLYSLD